MNVLGIIKMLVLVSSTVLLSSCDGDSSEDDQAGVCVVIYEDALLTLNTATVHDSSVTIEEVFISNIIHDGQVQEIDRIVQSNNSSLVASEDGLSAICTLPCTLLENEGEYSMLVSADGYEDDLLEFSAEYEMFEGGCPAFYRGGRTLDVVLFPE